MVFEHIDVFALILSPIIYSKNRLMHIDTIKRNYIFNILRTLYYVPITTFTEPFCGIGSVCLEQNWLQLWNFQSSLVANYCSIWIFNVRLNYMWETDPTWKTALYSGYKSMCGIWLSDVLWTIQTWTIMLEIKVPLFEYRVVQYKT